MKKYLLFDLDGTLTDPRLGICTCVQYALSFFDIIEPDLKRLEPFIGPPLKDSFMEFYHMSGKDADKAIEKYRERFRDKGIFENKMYKGIPAMLRDLKAKGMVLAVASSKPTVFVKRILDYFHIEKYFDVVVGSELDGSRVKKDQVVGEVLRQLFGNRPVEKSQVYMIGDRRFDVEGAHKAGVECVGVTYGYGSMEELKGAKADYIVRSVEELHRFLLRGTEDPDRIRPFQKLWAVLFPFLLFYLVRGIAADLLVLGVDYMGQGQMLLQGVEGSVRLSGNGAAMVSALSFAAAAGAVFNMARSTVTATRWNTRLEHLRPEPGICYVFLGVAALGLVLGMNMLLGLLGLTEQETYRAVAESQYGAGLAAGLFCYGLIAPVAEELLFRGIIYGEMRRFIKPLPAMVLSAALFGVYHANIVQGVYAFVIGCLLAYGYEYFGDFRLPVAVHIAANLLVYSLSYAGVGETGFVSWPVCLISLVCGAGSVVVLRKKKKIITYL